MMESQAMARPADLMDEDFLQDIKARLLARGATDALVSTSRSRSLGASVRKGEFEGVSHKEGTKLGLSAMIGTRSAGVSTNDPSPDVIETLIDRVVRMAELADDDPFGGLPDAAQLAPGNSDDELEIVDPDEPTVERLEDMALELEGHAREAEGVSETQGASAGWSYTETRVVGSNGLSRRSRGTTASASVSTMASRGEDRQLGDFSHAAHWWEDLLPLREIGRRAGARAVEKLGSRKIASCRAPVIFDRRVSFQLLVSFLRAISGEEIYQGQTYLPDALGAQVFPKGFSLIEDPFRKRGHSSRIADAEGMVPFHGPLVEDGMVRSLILGLYDSRRLGMPPTGHAGGISNLTVMPGTLDRAGLIREAGRGLIVTGVMGSSANSFTGDFSMGISGLWFEGGEIAYPVSEMTIAGNFKRIFANLVAGADIEYLSAAEAPSLLTPPLAIGGI